MPKIALAVTDKRGHYIERVQGHMLGIYIYICKSFQEKHRTGTSCPSGKKQNFPHFSYI